MGIFKAKYSNSLAKIHLIHIGNQYTSWKLVQPMLPSNAPEHFIKYHIINVLML